MNLTSRWKTVAIVGYTQSVSHYQNRMAHGGVCLLQAKKNKDKIFGREVNSNGRHEEVGEKFSLDNETLEHWLELSKSNK